MAGRYRLTCAAALRGRSTGPPQGGVLLLLLLLLLLGCALSAPLQLPPSPLAVLLGGNLSIPLSYPLTQPPPSIVWQNNQMTLVTGRLGPNSSIEVAQAYQGRLHVDPQGGGLSIVPVVLQDTGTYVVEVFPLGGQTWRGEVQVQVYELVGNVSVTPPSLEVAEGAVSAVLTCTPVRGTVTWSKEGQSLAQNPRYRLLAGSLQISQPNRSDSGTYGCTVSNPFSSGTGTANVRVYYGPELPVISVSSDRNPEPWRYVLVNSSVTLTCRATSDPPAQIYWSLADASDPLVPSQPNLTLPQVQLSQAGLYSCLASNPQTQHRLRATLSLTVIQIPPGSPFCSLDLAGNGTALRFGCSWLGGSPAPSLSLQGLPGGEEQGVGPTLEHTLTSPPASLNGTRVTCLGRHLAAEGNCSMTPEAPSGVSLSFQASLAPKGPVLVQLQCQGTYRPVEISWARAGASLGPGGRYQLSADGAQLTISNFTAPQDLGSYSVRCQNPLGWQESNLTLAGSGGASSTGGWGVEDAAGAGGRHSLQHCRGAPASEHLRLPPAAPTGSPGRGAQPHPDTPARKEGEEAPDSTRVPPPLPAPPVPQWERVGPHRAPRGDPALLLGGQQPVHHQLRGASAHPRPPRLWARMPCRQQELWAPVSGPWGQPQDYTQRHAGVTGAGDPRGSQESGRAASPSMTPGV
ncbi:V-set and immunoglobulin domain-containing protein 10-like isoform X4 [Carettochelys insculpta]|uniref:V-set and immunoglobulin domain-containing protein 10-like isoform X4 n=1 Tax=Carettochelys insculpta TaxID=44489 RepID=UPI003EBC0005